MKKILTILGTLSLITSSSLSLIGCKKENIQNDEQDLNQIIKNKNLGWLGDKKPEIILKALKSKNSNLDTNELEIIGTPSDTSATIQAKSNSQKYKGWIDVKYDVKELLKWIIKYTNLKKISRKVK